MANFLKITDSPDVEVILDVDKIERIKRTATSNVIYMGGTSFRVSDEAYEKIRERIFNPFGSSRKT